MSGEGDVPLFPASRETTIAQVAIWNVSATKQEVMMNNCGVGAKIYGVFPCRS
jgi:hypothetical protein